MDERKLRNYEFMRRGDIVRYKDGKTMVVKAWAGSMVKNFINDIHSGVYRPQKSKEVSKSTHNKSSFQLPSFSAWKKRILKDYEKDGCDWVAMQDFYDYMKELVNKKR